MITKIDSPNNQLIKEVLNLQLKSKERKKLVKSYRRFKEISLAIKFNVSVEKILFCPEIIDLDSVKQLIGGNIIWQKNMSLAKAFSKISYRKQQEELS